LKNQSCPTVIVVLHLRHVAEVLAKDSRQEGDRHEDRRDDRELLHHGIQPVRDGRQIDVEQTAHQVAVRIQHLEGADEMIVYVAKVRLCLRWDVFACSRDQRVRHLHTGTDDPPHARHLALDMEDARLYLIRGTADGEVFELIDHVVKVVEHGEVTINQPREDGVEQIGAATVRGAVLAVVVGHCLAQASHPVEWIAVERDEKALAEDDIHLWRDGVLRLLVEADRVHHQIEVIMPLDKFGALGVLADGTHGQPR
jgi:hypothetical protein